MSVQSFCGGGGGRGGREEFDSAWTEYTAAMSLVKVRCCQGRVRAGTSRSNSRTCQWTYSHTLTRDAVVPCVWQVGAASIEHPGVVPRGPSGGTFEWSVD